MNSKPSLDINVTWVEGVAAIVFWGGEDVGCGEMIGGKAEVSRVCTSI